MTLLEVADRLEGNPRAVLFEQIDGCELRLAGNVMGGRDRLARALGVDRGALVAELGARLNSPIAPVEVGAAESPCQQVVLTGADADLLDLPVHLQHERDGAPYISAAIDFAVNASGATNVGVRRLMLRGPHTTGVDLNAPSDLRAIYRDAVERGEPLPVAFVVGSHPADYLAATPAASGDELAVLGGVRGQAVPVVRCVTQPLFVPADAEVVIEGYLDPHGFTEVEGPYGEYLGYYGTAKMNPLFRLTAVTRRTDAIFQTATIGGRMLQVTDTSQLVAVAVEVLIWQAVSSVVREPVAVHATASSGGMNVRLSLNVRYPGESRNAIAAIFASSADVKHVFVTDADVDVSSDSQIDWALATRFQANRDLVVANGFRATPLDPSLGSSDTFAKVGFDLTKGSLGDELFDIPAPPSLNASESPPASVVDSLGRGPMTFAALMRATGSTDGREVVRALDDLDQSKKLIRMPDGSYSL